MFQIPHFFVRLKWNKKGSQGMKRIRVTLLLAAALCCAPLAKAQLTLSRCLELAKEFSLRSRAADKAIRASELSRDELLKTRLPQVKFSSEALLAPHSGRFGYDAATTDGGQITGRVVVEQSLYDAGVRGLRSGQLGLERDALVKEKQVFERDLVFEVEQDFIEVLRAQREIELQQQSMQQLKDYLELVQRLAKGGGASSTDILKTRVQLNAADRSLQKARESLASAKYAIAELTGAAIDTAYSVTGSLESLLPGRRTAGTPTDVSQNLDIALTQLTIDRSTIETEIAKSDRLPVISAYADAGMLSSGDNFRLPAAERIGAYGYSVGLSLEVPIMNWGATDLRIQQRQLVTDALGFQLEALRRSVTTQYRTVQLQLSKAEERLLSLRASMEAAEENFELTKSKYAGGGALSLEVLSAQQLLTDIRLEELQTLAEKQLVLARLEQITTR
jgi:outer membrane protein